MCAVLRLMAREAYCKCVLCSEVLCDYAAHYARKRPSASSALLTASIGSVQLRPQSPAPVWPLAFAATWPLPFPAQVRAVKRTR